MLEGKYLWDIPDSLVDIWEYMENWAIEDIVERILMIEKRNQSGVGSTASYRLDMLNRIGMNMDEVYARLQDYTKMSQKELKELFIDAGADCLENDNKVFLEHGLKSVFESDNKWVRQIMDSMYRKTNGELKNFTGTFASTYQTVLFNLLDEIFVEVSTGMRSRSEATADVIEKLGRIGITRVNYESGHSDTVEVAVRRAVITGINRMSLDISVENCRRMGAEYVIVSSHLGARVSEDKIANHAGWQGKVYKIDGADKVAPNLQEETGWPKDPRGLGGYNCRHNMFPWFPGDGNPFAKYGKEENEKAYELSQKQRAKERAIRKSKRELLALKKGLELADSDELREELQERYDKAAFRYTKRNKDYKKFCEDNDLKTKNERLKIAKWNRSDAGTASAGAKRYILEKLAPKGNSSKENIVANDEKSVKINIDELTPCLLRRSDNRIIETTVIDVIPTKEDYKDWEFDWTIPLKNGYTIRAIKADGDDRIQGMIAMKSDLQNYAVAIDIVEAAPFNNPHNKIYVGKEYSGVGGHLFAEAVKESMIQGYDGYVYFKAKTDLVEYYKKELGAVVINAKERIMAIEEGSAKKLYEQYYKSE